MKRKKNFPGLLIFCLWFAADVYAKDGQEWVGLEESRFAFHVNYGQDSDGESNLGLGLTIPAFAYSEFFLAYSQYAVEEGSTSQNLDDYSLSWRTDPYADWQLGLGYSFKGKREAVEVVQKQLELYRALENWQVGLLYFAGDVKGYTRETISDRFNIPDSAQITRDGYGVALSHFGSTWSWQLNAESFDYSRDLSNALNSRLFMLSFNNAVISQVLVLTNWNISLQLKKQFNASSFSLGVGKFEEVVVNRQDTTLFGGVDFVINDNIDLTLNYLYLTEEQSSQLGLGAVFSW